MKKSTLEKQVLVPRIAPSTTPSPFGIWPQQTPPPRKTWIDNTPDPAEELLKEYHGEGFYLPGSQQEYEARQKERYRQYKINRWKYYKSKRETPTDPTRPVDRYDKEEAKKFAADTLGNWLFGIWYPGPTQPRRIGDVRARGDLIPPKPGPKLDWPNIERLIQWKLIRQAGQPGHWEPPAPPIPEETCTYDYNEHLLTGIPLCVPAKSGVQTITSKKATKHGSYPKARTRRYRKSHRQTYPF